MNFPEESRDSVFRSGGGGVVNHSATRNCFIDLHDQPPAGELVYERELLILHAVGRANDLEGIMATQPFRS